MWHGVNLGSSTSVSGEMLTALCHWHLQPIPKTSRWHEEKFPWKLFSHCWSPVHGNSLILQHKDDSGMNGRFRLKYKSLNGNTVRYHYITLSNIKWLCIHHCTDCNRIQISVSIHKRHPKPRPNGWAMGCLLWWVFRKLTRYNSTTLTVS